MGAVGKRVVHAATLGFGMRVLVFSPSVGAARITESGATPVDSLYALLEEADIVSLHGRLSDKTRHMIDAAALARMKAGSVLINTARGALIDEVALAVALTAAAERADADEPSGIAGAALDTFATEPLPADSPLRSVPAARLLLTPHHATQTRGAFRNMAQAAAASIVDILNGVPVDPRRIAT
jgi:D-3-phosphoglycerate dehydrogenase